MFGYDRLFDFNRDGKLDLAERAVQYQFMEDIFNGNHDDDDNVDVFGDAGLNYDELECMDPNERREVLKEAGLDPDEFDF